MTTPTRLLSGTTTAKLIAAIREAAAGTPFVDEVLADLAAAEMEQALDLLAELLARGHKVQEGRAAPEGGSTCRHCNAVLRWCDCGASGAPHWSDRNGRSRYCLTLSNPGLHDVEPTAAAARAQTLHTRREAGHVG